LPIDDRAAGGCSAANYTRLQQVARIDFVTGVANNTVFYESVTVEMARHRRSKAPVAEA